MKHLKVTQNSLNEKDDVLIDKYEWVLDAKLPNEWKHELGSIASYNQPGIINLNEDIRKKVDAEIARPKQMQKEKEEFDNLPDKAKEEIKNKEATIDRLLHTIDLQEQRGQEHKVILVIAVVTIVVLFLVSLGVNF